MSERDPKFMIDMKFSMNMNLAIFDQSELIRLVQLKCKELTKLGFVNVHTEEVQRAELTP